jgi:hypothetical protein
MKMKKIYILIIALVISLGGLIWVLEHDAYPSEPIAENSGALTAAKVLAVGPGGVMFVLCQHDGTHATCGCSIFDSASLVQSATQLPGIQQYNSNSLNSISWMSTNPIRFSKGLYVSPAQYSTCYVSWTYGQ